MTDSGKFGLKSIILSLFDRFLRDLCLNLNIDFRLNIHFGICHIPQQLNLLFNISDFVINLIYRMMFLILHCQLINLLKFLRNDLRINKYPFLDLVLT